MKVIQSCLTLWDPMSYTVHGIRQARILEWVAFPISRGSSHNPRLKPGLLHCGQILYQLSHKGSSRILKWIDYPFSSGSSRPRNRTRFSCVAGGFFTNWAIREALMLWRRAWQPPPVFLPGDSPRTEEPGGLLSLGSQALWQKVKTRREHLHFNFQAIGLIQTHTFHHRSPMDPHGPI